MKNQYTEENFFGYAYETNHLTMDYPQYIRKDALLEWANGTKKDISVQQQKHPQDNAWFDGESFVLDKLIEKLQEL